MRMPLPRVKARGRPKASSPLLIVGLRFANPTYPGSTDLRELQIPLPRVKPGAGLRPPRPSLQRRGNEGRAF